MKNVRIVVAVLCVVVLFSLTVYAEYGTCVDGGSQLNCLDESTISNSNGTSTRVHFDSVEFFDDSIVAGEDNCCLYNDPSELKKYFICTSYLVFSDGTQVFINSVDFDHEYGREICSTDC